MKYFLKSDCCGKMEPHRQVQANSIKKMLRDARRWHARHGHVGQTITTIVCLVKTGKHVLTKKQRIKKEDARGNWGEL